MTVIAYRNGVMAGDSCWSDGSADTYAGLITNVQTKIMRLPSGALYGGAGATDDRALVRLLAKVRRPQDLPPASEISKPEYEDLVCLFAFPNAGLWLITAGPTGNGVEPVSTRFAAVGTGAPLAIGAMARGATAAQAVHIACKHNVFCRPPVHTLTLEPPRASKRR